MDHIKATEGIDCDIVGSLPGELAWEFGPVVDYFVAVFTVACHQRFGVGLVRHAEQYWASALAGTCACGCHGNQGGMGKEATTVHGGKSDGVFGLDTQVYYETGRFEQTHHARHDLQPGQKWQEIIININIYLKRILILLAFLYLSKMWTFPFLLSIK